ncbi:MAG TPA: maleylpyruvate isomerase N-terminal domain-containing protein [Actinomycetes bacterium]|nr:maleylpyruvate isomerase N-terminal domain-containing protein [Actinomycetes bacterium]
MTTTEGSDQPARADEATPPMSVAEHIKVVGVEGQSFAAAARRGAWDAPVPACPGWDLRDLVRHLGEIHLWAAANVARRPGAKLDLDDRSELATSWPDLAVFWPADDDLIDWYLQTSANLVEALESAPSDMLAETFLPAPSPLAMWARRQAHETAVHRFDAENATGTTTGFDPVFAADGVSELLYGFYENVPRPEEKAIPLERDHTIHVHADDTGNDWYMTLGRRSITRAHTDAPIDLALAGTACDLYLALWNRGDDVTITATGDRRLLETWHTYTGLRWDLD